jgi:hypothetical protein
VDFLQELREDGLCIEIPIYLLELPLLKEVIPILQTLQLEDAVHELIDGVYLHNQKLFVEDLVVFWIKEA